MTRRVFIGRSSSSESYWIVAPFAISLPSKASAGQAMLDNFHPIMQPASVKQTVSLYENTFLKLKPVASGGIAAAGEETALLKGLATGLHLSPPQLEQYLGGQFPAFAQLLASFPQLVPVFSQVGPGLAITSRSWTRCKPTCRTTNRWTACRTFVSSRGSSRFPES